MSHGGWTAEQYVPGRTLLPGDRMRLSGAVRRLHRIAAGLPQRPGFASARDLISRLTGGDIDLSDMPESIVAQCRRAFAAVPTVPQTVVHGDFTSENVAVAGTGQFVFYDWDEARVDHPLFDLVAMGLIEHPVPRRAVLAFEVASCWHREPDRARELARLL